MLHCFAAREGWLGRYRLAEAPESLCVKTGASSKRGAPRPHTILGSGTIAIAFAWIVAATLLIGGGNTLVAGDYFLTIAGGYHPSGNQASLEENVVFFQQILSEKELGLSRHDLYFADGDDETADLQVLAAKPVVTQSDRPATDLLASLHRRRGEERVEYRNHRVPKVSGPLNPELVRGSLESIAKAVHDGDRLIIYVTAHGSAGPKDDEYNTTIDCWDEKKITAREFTEWLDRVPSKVPVVMVMAQCYCGGFSRTIFDGLDINRGLSSHQRAGFFAQQYDLPAAGCRPDIEHDQEFSSYFWGAIAGRSRVGTPIEGCDLDGNGVVSFSEAYAYAFWASETIDIPLVTSDVFLRTYSRMKDSSPMSGTLQSFVDRGRVTSGRIVSKLSQVLGFTLQDDVTSVVAAYDEHWSHPVLNGGRGGRRGGGAGRRELLKEVTEKWPELGDRKHWEESPLLKAENQQQLLAELKELPSFKTFQERRAQLEKTGDQSGRHELREVKFRRLIKTLELILLEQNLPQVASPELVQRYWQLIALEDSVLGSGK